MEVFISSCFDWDEKRWLLQCIHHETVMFQDK